MERFLSVSDVADHLQISVNTINARIRAGDFPAPDAMIGSRYQGWKASTIDDLSPMAPPRLINGSDAHLLARIASDFRRVAEQVRAYAFAPTGSSSRVVRAADIIVRLHTIGTRIELGARIFTYAEQQNIRALKNLTPDGATQPQDDTLQPVMPPQAPEEVELQGLTAVPVFLTPVGMSPDAVSVALANLADEVDALTGRLLQAVEFPSPGKIPNESASLVVALREIAHS